MRRTFNTRVKLHNPHRGIVPTPSQLKPIQTLRYPEDNAATFERWYMDNYSTSDARDRLYLPIQWTALYVNGDFGKNRNVIAKIQSFLDGLDKSKKYYTIVQFDDGILNNLSGLDIVVMGMSGGRIDYSLPLLCWPHKFRFAEKRDIFASFVGRVTHPIRQKLIEEKYPEDWYVSDKPHDLKEYCRILARSKFALCPRGYGKSSFRIQEAIQHGAIPVYISDEFIMPYGNAGEYMLSVEQEELPGIVDFLTCLPNAMLTVMQQNIVQAQVLYSYAGAKNKILEYLKI